MKNKVIHCKFAASLDDKVKDKFVTGLLKGPLLDNLCAQEVTMCLNDIVEKARTKEATLKRSSKKDNADSIHHAHPYYNRASSGKGNNNIRNHPRDMDATSSSSSVHFKEPTCNICGNTRHNFAKCKYKSLKCAVCKKIGHLGKVCKKRFQMLITLRRRRRLTD